MAARRRSRPLAPPDEAIFSVKKTRRVPFDFVLDELEELGPYTKPMFGCTAVYVQDKIVFVLRDRPSSRDDNGVWIATTVDHHESLRLELPIMRSIRVFGSGVTGWQVLPWDAPEFEEAVLRACALVRRGDARIGKIPKKSAVREASARAAGRGSRPSRRSRRAGRGS